MPIIIELSNLRKCETTHKLMAGKHMTETLAIRGTKTKP